MTWQINAQSSSARKKSEPLVYLMLFPVLQAGSFQCIAQELGLGLVGKM